MNGVSMDHATARHHWKICLINLQGNVLQPCNDFYLPNTPENRDLLERTIRFHGEEEHIEEQVEQIRKCKDEKLIIVNWLLVDYILHAMFDEIPSKYGDE